MKRQHRKSTIPLCSLAWRQQSVMIDPSLPDGGHGTTLGSGRCQGSQSAGREAEPSQKSTTARVMSIRVMQWVWNHSAARGNSRLVLLAIADHAHDDGGGAWPSQEALARKCLVSKKTVQRAIADLVELTELEVERYGGPVVTGTQGQRTHRYRIAMGDQSDNLSVWSDKPERQSVRPERQSGATSATTVSNEPSINPLSKPSSLTDREEEERSRLARWMFDHCKPERGRRASLNSCRKLVDRARDELGFSLYDAEQVIGKAITVHDARTLAFFRNAFEPAPNTLGRDRVDGVRPLALEREANEWWGGMAS
jgi:hypothetical protein